MAGAEYLVDAVPDQVSADPAGMQGIMNVDVAFYKEVQAAHVTG
jgi:hypothetical protein